MAERTKGLKLSERSKAVVAVIKDAAPMKKIAFSGKVFSSRGEGKKFLSLPWVKLQIKQKLGFTPYAGTLNLKLSAENTRHKEVLEKTCSMEILPVEGYCRGKLFKAFIGEIECAVVIPEVLGYPKDMLEIVAPVCLREALKLKDGDEVTVTVIL
ncbi:MAG: CTP-dependent riboflavin kinase [Candidatus Bathyarchaeota archaeon]|nr:CTP-dependent riboflavin kinase [Candidatus Bathyarchaeota archaeon]